MEKTFDELTDLIYEQHGRPNWSEIEIVFMGVPWKVKSALTRPVSRTHVLGLVNRPFELIIEFREPAKLQNLLPNVWHVRDKDLVKIPDRGNRFNCEPIPAGTLCQIISNIGVLNSPHVPWPTSDMGFVDVRDNVFVLDMVESSIGIFSKVICKHGVGFVIRDTLIPSPSLLYVNL